MPGGLEPTAISAPHTAVGQGPPYFRGSPAGVLSGCSQPDSPSA
jgi:hypothetical protein